MTNMVLILYHNVIAYPRDYTAYPKL